MQSLKVSGIDFDGPHLEIRISKKNISVCEGTHLGEADRVNDQFQEGRF